MRLGFFLGNFLAAEIEIDLDFLIQAIWFIINQSPKNYVPEKALKTVEAEPITSHSMGA